VDLQDLGAEFRSQVSDEAQPYLWSDDEVLRYIIDAQDMFVRNIGGLSDMSTTEIVDVDVTAGNPWSVHSPYILRVRSGRLLTAKRDVEMIGEGQVGTTTMIRDYGWTNSAQLDDDDIGIVRFGVLGLEEKKIRWVQVPSESDTVRLHVFRLPYPRIPGPREDEPGWDAGVPLEIDEHHHRHLILWMKHLAYSKQDAEARDDKKAADNKLAFEEYCKKAKIENERRAYKPRVVAYNPF
jgi:hypothetical protein